MNNNPDIKKELLQTIEDFKSIENNSQDLSQFLNDKLLVFNKRNHILYVENNNGKLDIYMYEFVFEDENFKYSSTVDVEKLVFPDYITNDRDCLIDAKESLSLLIAILTGHTCNIFVDTLLPFIYDGSILAKDKSVLIRVPYSKQTLDNIDFSCIKSISKEACNNISAINDDVFNSLVHAQKIYDEAFYECNRFNDISCSNELYFIGNDAFKKSSIRTIDLSQTSISSINMRTFKDCKSLISISLPSTLQSIGYEAFDSCSNLQILSIQYGITNHLGVHNTAFNDCSNLLSVIIHNNNIKDDILSGKTYFWFNAKINA